MHDSLITIIFFYLHSRMGVLFTNTTISAFFSLLFHRFERFGLSSPKFDQPIIRSQAQALLDNHLQS